MSRTIFTDSQLDRKARMALSGGKKLTTNALKALIGCSRQRVMETAKRIGATFDSQCKFSLASGEVSRVVKDKKKINAINKRAREAAPAVRSESCQPVTCTGCRGVIVVVPCILCTLNGKTGMRYASVVRNSHVGNGADVPARGIFTTRYQ